MSKLVKRGTFDEHPITLGGVVLRHNKADIAASTSDEELAQALKFAASAAESSPYWVGDIVAFTEDRETRMELRAQVLEVTDIAPTTLTNLASISRRVKPSERELAPTIGHAETVAKMDRADQRKWLGKAKTEGWTVREFRMEVQAAQKRGVIEGHAELEGMFRTWLIDYPWKYSTSQPSGTNAQTHYPGMDIHEGLKWAEQVRAHCTRQAVSFWWVTAPFLYYATQPELGPDAYRIMRAAGFTPKTGGVWDKVKHNFGHYLSIRHEHLIIAVRGEGMTPDRPTPMFDSVWTEQASDVHSEKPESVAKMVERLYDGPYIECFARQRRKGWTCWGNQVNKLVGASRQLVKK